jgi:hypothetical protein
LSVQADPNPTLGGNLNLNNRNITGTGNITIVGSVTATQFVGPLNLVQNLNLNNYNITGTGNVQITGNLVNTVTTSQAINGATLTLSGVNNNGMKAGIEIITDGSADDLYSLFNIRGRNTSATGNVIGFERGRGTHLNPSRLLTGDEIMTLVWFGLDHTSTPTPSAAIRVSVTGVTNSGIVPGKIELATADAAGNLTPGITIGSDQIVEFANKTVTANSGSGSANVSGGVSTYLKIKVNGVQYAMPLYGIVP